MDYLPSKKFFVFLFAILIIGGVAFAYGGRNSFTQKTTTNDFSGVRTPRNIGEALVKDDDNDGLRDWEELLWKTDPTNPDTDGDGTKDGDEVAAGRDPAIPGPDDFLPDGGAKRLAGESLAARGKSETATEQLARDVFSGYITLKQSGSLSALSQQQFIETVAKKEYVSASSKTYTPDDFTLASDTGTGAARAYGDELGLIINTYSLQNENEAVILKRSLQKNDKKEIEKLDPIINAYEEIITRAEVMAVPQDARALHAEFLTAMSDVQATIQSMRAVYKDPLTALVNISKYQEDALNLYSSLTDLHDYFLKSGVVFEQSDNGYFFTAIANLSN